MNKLRFIIKECIREIMCEQRSKTSAANKFPIDKSKRTGKFKKLTKSLPTRIQTAMVKRYEEWKNTGILHGFHELTDDPSYRGTYKLELPEHYRAMAFEDNGELIWVWVGSHEDYNGIWRGLAIRNNNRNNSQRRPRTEGLKNNLFPMVTPDGRINL